MPQVNKIEKYELEKRVLALSGAGETTLSIAEIISKEIKEKGIDDNISQAAVSRWIKSQRAERKEQTQQVVSDKIQETVTADMDALEVIKNKFFTEFNNTGNNLKTRAQMGLNVVKVVETKLRFGGLGDDKESIHPADIQSLKDNLEEFKNNE